MFFWSIPPEAYLVTCQKPPRPSGSKWRRCHAVIGPVSLPANLMWSIQLSNSWQMIKTQQPRYMYDILYYIVCIYIYIYTVRNRDIAIIYNSIYIIQCSPIATSVIWLFGIPSHRCFLGNPPSPDREKGAPQFLFQKPPQRCGSRLIPMPGDQNHPKVLQLHLYIYPIVSI